MTHILSTVSTTGNTTQRNSHYNQYRNISFELVYKTTYALSALQSLVYSTHTADLNFFCVCLRYIVFCLLTHLLTTKTNTEKFLLFAMHWATTNSGQLYLIYFFIPYYCYTVNTFQKRIETPQSY